MFRSVKPGSGQTSQDPIEESTVLPLHRAGFLFIYIINLLMSYGDDSQKAPQASPDFPDAFYRVSVKGLLVQDGKLLMCRDMVNEWKTPGGKWELPGGGVDFGEDCQTALAREVTEEMGLEVTWIADRPLYIWFAKHEHARGMAWYHVLTLCFPFTLKNLDFTPSIDCQEIQFFTKEELGTVRIASQIENIKNMFNPEDFKKL